MNNALEEFKACAEKSHAIQARIWPMASVLLLFSLGGLPLLGPGTADKWEEVALVGLAGFSSISVVWLWRMIDWSETYWQDIVYQRMWELERNMGFLANRMVKLLLLRRQDVMRDEDWKLLSLREKKFIARLRSTPRPARMRTIFNLIAATVTVAWLGLFALKAIEYALSDDGNSKQATPTRSYQDSN